MRGGRRSWQRALVASAYGVTDEYHQSFVPATRNERARLDRRFNRRAGRRLILVLCLLVPCCSCAGLRTASPAPAIVRGSGCQGLIRFDVCRVDLDADTAWPIRSTDSTSRAFGASFRTSRPTTPRSGPWTTSTIIPS